MGTQSGSQNIDVKRSILGESLHNHPGRYNFFQAVRLMERLYDQRERVGRFAQPTQEALRFGVNNSLAFPPGQIDAIDWNENSQPQMSVNFIGLTGPNGILPHSYTELLRDRSRAKDHALRDFFDLFNHRMISLFYQAWEKYRFYVSYERDQQDRFSRYLMSFVGLGTDGLENRQLLRDETFLFYSGLLSLQPRSAVALEQIVSDYFEVPVRVGQFVGTWRTLPTSDLCSFDSDDEYSCQLGRGAVAGDEIWDTQARVRIEIGPVSLERYLEFLPGGSGCEPLRGILNFYANREFEFEIQLILKRDEVPACDLASRPTLGWTTWMNSGLSFGRDPGDTILLLT